MSYGKQLHSLLDESSASSLPAFDVELRWDPRSFNTAQLQNGRGLRGRLNRSVWRFQNGRHKPVPTNRSIQFREALEVAIDRYEQQRQAKDMVEEELEGQDDMEMGGSEPKKQRRT